MGWKAAALGCLMALLWIGSAQAEDQQPDSKTYEGRAVGAFLTYCVPPILAGDSVAPVASELGKFPELPPPAQTAFLKGQPGKVFALPQVGPGIVLTAPQSPMCSVIMQTVDAGEFLNQTDFWFDPGHSPFTRTVDQTAANGDIHREYTGNVKGRGVLLLLNVRPKPVQGAIQAMLTAGRTQ
jgi:hypothetical protein